MVCDDARLVMLARRTASVMSRWTADSCKWNGVVAKSGRCFRHMTWKGGDQKVRLLPRGECPVPLVSALANVRASVVPGLQREGVVTVRARVGATSGDRWSAAT